MGWKKSAQESKAKRTVSAKPHTHWRNGKKARVTPQGIADVGALGKSHIMQGLTS